MYGCLGYGAGGVAGQQSGRHNNKSYPYESRKIALHLPAQSKGNDSMRRVLNKYKRRKL